MFATKLNAISREIAKGGSIYGPLSVLDSDDFYYSLSSIWSDCTHRLPNAASYPVGNSSIEHELQTGNSTAVRAQIALYRLERQDAVVAQAQQRLSNAKLRLTDAESERGKKAIQIQSAKDTATRAKLLMRRLI